MPKIEKKPKYILFSPVGLTDPIRSDHDGPLLHILRRYPQPEAIYLYMTQFVFEQHRMDLEQDAGRCCRYAKCIGEVLPNFPPECIYFMVEGEESPHLFNNFEQVFYNRLNQIISTAQATCGEDEQVKVLLNLSSGTPQMQVALHLLSAILPPNEIAAVQVSGPPHGKTSPPPDRAMFVDEMQFRAAMERLRANELPLTSENNRCVVVAPDRLSEVITLQNVISHVKNCEYESARRLYGKTGRAKALLSANTKHYINAIWRRTHLEVEYAFKELTDGGMNPLEVFCFCERPGAPSQQQILHEYILYMQLKLYREEYLDFARAISPVFTDLLVALIERCGGTMSDLTSEVQRGRLSIPMLNPAVAGFPPALMRELDRVFPPSYRPSALAASNLVIVAEYYIKQHYATLSPDYPTHLPSDETACVRCFATLRDFESKVRNLAAHQIVAVSESWCKLNRCASFAEVLENLKLLYSYVYGAPPMGWKDYHIMNNRAIAFIRDEMLG